MKDILSFLFARKLYCLICFTGVCLILLLVITFRGNHAIGNSYVDKQCKSVCIEEGDTLWSIASTYYVPECGSMKEYISEIKKTNHLTTDTIYAGRYLLIPYYITAGECSTYGN